MQDKFASETLAKKTKPKKRRETVQFRVKVK